MTSDDGWGRGVMRGGWAAAGRLYETNAEFGVVKVCAAFATTMEVMITTTVAKRMTPGRENFWIRILIAFILFGFLSVLGFMCGFVHRAAVIAIPARMSILKMAQPFTESSMKAGLLMEPSNALFAVLDGFYSHHGCEVTAMRVCNPGLSTARIYR